MKWMLASLVAGICLAATCDSRAGDYTVSRGTSIESQRPIAVLALEAMMGVIHGGNETAGGLAGKEGRGVLGSAATELWVDGKRQRSFTSFRAAYRLVGIILWDASGRIERVTTATVRNHAVTITDYVVNGKLVVTVVVGPPLGDPRVRYAVLRLEAQERGHVANLHRRPLGGTDIGLSCSAVLDLPGDRCCLVRRFARRVAEREAGPELAGRVRTLEAAGREAVAAGRAELPEIVGRFIELMCSTASDRRSGR